MNQVNNKRRKPLTAEMRRSCYLSQARISAFSSLTLSCSYMYQVEWFSLISDQVQLCGSMWKDNYWWFQSCLFANWWKTMKDLLPQNQFLYFWPLPVKYRILLLHYCFQWIINNLFDLTVWTKVSHSNDKARFAITAVLTWTLKTGDVFADDYRINLTFIACLESS